MESAEEQDILHLNKLVSKLIVSDSRENSSLLKEEIITVLEKIFIKTGERKFETVLANYVISPLIPLYIELESLTSFSRIAVKKRKDLIQVKILIEFVFENYKSFLDQNEYYLDFKRKSLEKKNALKKLIIEELDSQIDWHKYNSLNHSKKELIAYLKNLEEDDNYAALVPKVKRFYSQAKDLKNVLLKQIQSCEKKIEEFRDKIIKTEDYKTDFFNLNSKEILAENITELTMERDRYREHYEQIRILIDNIRRKYSFIEFQEESDIVIQYITHDKVKHFLELEHKLISHSYLKNDDFGLHWNKNKIQLVNFCRFITMNNLLRTGKSLSDFIKFIEVRYKTNVGDMKKQSKFTGLDSDVENDFEFLS